MCECPFMKITINNMVLFSCRLVGCTPVDCVCASVVLVWEISGESPFSSRACRYGKLGSLLNRTGRFPVVGLSAEPLPTAPTPSPLDGKGNALLSPPTNPPLLSPLSLVPELCNWLNFSMHSSIRAGGAFLWATLTRPQNNTSNLLAKAVGDTATENAMVVDVVEREEKHFSGGSLPPMEVLLERMVMSSLRAELFPACLNVLMISGTWRVSKQEKITCNHCNKTLHSSSAKLHQKTTHACLQFLADHINVSEALHLEPVKYFEFASTMCPKTSSNLMWLLNCLFLYLI